MSWNQKNKREYEEENNSNEYLEFVLFNYGLLEDLTRCCCKSVEDTMKEMYEV